MRAFLSRSVHSLSFYCSFLFFNFFYFTATRFAALSGHGYSEASHQLSCSFELHPLLSFASSRCAHVLLYFSAPLSPSLILSLYTPSPRVSLALGLSRIHTRTTHTQAHTISRSLFLRLSLSLSLLAAHARERSNTKRSKSMYRRNCVAAKGWSSLPLTRIFVFYCIFFHLSLVCRFDFFYAASHAQ